MYAHLTTILGLLSCYCSVSINRDNQFIKNGLSITRYTVLLYMRTTVSPHLWVVCSARTMSERRRPASVQSADTFSTGVLILLRSAKEIPIIDTEPPTVCTGRLLWQLLVVLFNSLLVCQKTDLCAGR
jgi:hypothetical protein